MERLEILGKMEGVDIFDMRPLDASRKGTLKEPILVRSAGDEQYAGCTGYPVDSHGVIWLTVSCTVPIFLFFQKKKFFYFLPGKGRDQSILRAVRWHADPEIDLPRPPRRALPRVRQRL